MRHLFLKAVEKIASSHAGAPPVMPSPPSVTFTIPADHPLAPKLIELSRLLASKRQLESGLVVENSSPCPPDLAEERILALLGEILGKDVLEQELEHLRRQKEQQELGLKAFQISQGIQVPKAQGELAVAAAKAGVLDGHFERSPGAMTEFLNRAEKQAATGKPGIVKSGVAKAGGE